MPGADKETDLTERIEAFLAYLKRGGSPTGPLRGSMETALKTTDLLRRVTAQARWSSAGPPAARQPPESSFRSKLQHKRSQFPQANSSASH